ncbi:hypothetical protein [Halobellus ordinarius]|nr:hypothetical protein [Halobellus sp. ZY16]
MKLAVFAVGLLVTRAGLKNQDRLMYYAPPLGMIVFGIGATAVNVLLIF